MGKTSSSPDLPGGADPLDPNASDDASPAGNGSDLKYAHAGRRRRRITEELFRCKRLLIVVKERAMQETRIRCNALVWRTPEKMREHLISHLTSDEIAKLSDAEIRELYTDAARIAQEGIPDNDEE
jgi:hypothetical protein